MLKIGNAIFVLLLAAVMSDVSLAGTNAVQDSSGLAWRMRPSKAELLPGEPICLIVDFNNLREESVDMSFGAEGISAFSVDIQDAPESGARRSSSISQAGIASIEYLRVPVKGQGSKKIVLNQWVSTLLPAGNYMVMCRVQPLLKVEPYVMRPIDLECQIEILERNDGDLEGILQNLFNISQNAETSHERDMASRMLAFSDSPLVTEYQLLIAHDRSLSLMTRNLAIEGLGRVGTTEAALKLVKLCTDPLLESYLHDTAALALHDQSWADTPKLRTIIERARKIWQRPTRLGGEQSRPVYEFQPFSTTDENGRSTGSFFRAGPSRGSAPDRSR